MPSLLRFTRAKAGGVGANKKSRVDWSEGVGGIVSGGPATTFRLRFLAPLFEPLAAVKTFGRAGDPAGGPGAEPQPPSILAGERASRLHNFVVGSRFVDELPTERCTELEGAVMSITIGAGVVGLIGTILGYNEHDLETSLKAIAHNVGVSHIAYMRFERDKSFDASLLSGIATYSFAWQSRYFLKQYVAIDPVFSHGINAVLPFDWAELPRGEPAVQEFLLDAQKHNVGLNGLSIPVRNRKDAFSMVSYTSNQSKPEWCEFKRSNMTKLQLISVLIDAASRVNQKLPLPAGKLSEREEQCLSLAAKGKTYENISGVLNISFASVKTYLDSARHKLGCINLSHAVGVAVASGVISPKSIHSSS